MNAMNNDRTDASAFTDASAVSGDTPMASKGGQDFTAGEARRLECRRALHLGRLGGELTLLSGRLWLTRDGDLGDHVLEAGQRLVLAVDENAVIEPWDAGTTASVRWIPRHQTFVAAVLAEPLRGLAFMAGKLAAGFAALARQAASSARWAEGRIDVSGGDSAASASRC